MTDRDKTRGTERKILIVDDQRGIRVLLHDILEDAGYCPLQVGNGRQALEVIDRTSPDLVLLDMKIPGMDGLEVLNEIKTKSPGTKVVIMTAFDDSLIKQEAFKKGAVAHFSKPFDIQELLETVKKETPLIEEAGINRHQKR
ncbi:response regulator [Sporolactobacillus sp. THM7-7]|nr:response regulator [Sporolactobacillus sp. THM7-7]